MRSVKTKPATIILGDFKAQIGNAARGRQSEEIGARIGKTNAVPRELYCSWIQNGSL